MAHGNAPTVAFFTIRALFPAFLTCTARQLPQSTILTSCEDVTKAFLLSTLPKRLILKTPPAESFRFTLNPKIMCGETFSSYTKKSKQNFTGAVHSSHNYFPIFENCNSLYKIFLSCSVLCALWLFVYVLTTCLSLISSPIFRPKASWQIISNVKIVNSYQHTSKNPTSAIAVL